MTDMLYIAGVDADTERESEVISKILKMCLVRCS